MSLDVYFIRHGESENNTLSEKLRAQHGLVAGRQLFYKQRSHDPPLTPLGAAQVDAVARRMRSECPDIKEIWVSYLRRALDSAAALQRELPEAKVIAMRDINEVGGSYRYDENLGQFVATTGSSNAQVRQDFPTFSFFDNVGDDDAGWYTLSGKEPHDHAVERAVRLMERLEERARTLQPSEEKFCIAVVTHGDFFKLITHQICVRLSTEQKCAAETHVKSAQDAFVNGTSDSDAWIKNTSVTYVSISNGNEPNPSPVAEAAVRWELHYLADACHLQSVL